MRARLLLAMLMVTGCSSFRASSDTGDAAPPDDGGVSSDTGLNDASPAGDAPSTLDAADGSAPTCGGSNQACCSGATCNASLACVAGTCVCTSNCSPTVLADNQSQPTVVVVDGTNVYWATEGGANGSVNQCPKAGCVGAPLQLGVGTSTGLAVDATRVYWGDFSGGTLLSCAIGGCSNSPTVISSTETQIEGVISDGVSLYWATNGKIRACTLPCDGTAHAPRTVTSGVGSVVDVAADQGLVFWAASSNANGCNAASCTPTVLGPGGSGMFATHGVVYFVGASNTIVACAAGGCNGQPRTIGTSTFPQNVVSDDINVYWRDDFGGIFRCSTSGCTGDPTFQTQQQGQPGGKMATDGLYLYWATSSQVLRAPK